MDLRWGLRRKPCILRDKDSLEQLRVGGGCENQRSLLSAGVRAGCPEDMKCNKEKKVQRDRGTSPRPKPDCGRPLRPCHHSLLHASHIHMGLRDMTPTPSTRAHLLGFQVLTSSPNQSGTVQPPSESFSPADISSRHISHASMQLVSAWSLLAKRRNPRALKDNTCLKHLEAGQR